MYSDTDEWCLVVHVVFPLVNSLSRWHGTRWIFGASRKWSPVKPVNLGLGWCAKQWDWAIWKPSIGTIKSPWVSLVAVIHHQITNHQITNHQTMMHKPLTNHQPWSCLSLPSAETPTPWRHAEDLIGGLWCTAELLGERHVFFYCVSSRQAVGW